MQGCSRCPPRLHPGDTLVRRVQSACQESGLVGRGINADVSRDKITPTLERWRVTNKFLALLTDLDRVMGYQLRIVWDSDTASASTMAHPGRYRSTCSRIPTGSSVKRNIEVDMALGLRAGPAVPTA